MKTSARSGPVRALLLCGVIVAIAVAACAPRSEAEARQTAQATPAPVPTATARVLARYPHDPRAFTQGLLIRDGRLFESAGGYTGSNVREVELASGKVLQQRTLPAGQFGEGLAEYGAELFSLTWQNGIGHRWRIADLQRVGQFAYTGEGWGLTSDGKQLILSDGTPVLRFLDPRTFAVARQLAVTADGAPLGQLNELEWVDGEILANVWHDTRIARIDPATGRVKGWIDLYDIVQATPRRDSEAVLNGIAWDRRTRQLYVTGKTWPTLYRIAWPVG